MRGFVLTRTSLVCRRLFRGVFSHLIDTAETGRVRHILTSVHHVLYLARTARVLCNVFVEVAIRKSCLKMLVDALCERKSRIF